MTGGLLTGGDDGGCEDCKRLRRQLTWHGEPPKCPKHANTGTETYYG
jgi:hypothetical protein